MPGREELPSTLQRSPRRAQETWIKTHDSAVQEYGEGERAHRTAFGALKHSFEKVGDHWEPKEDGRKGPSDEQSAQPYGRSGESFGGVDANASKKHLLDLARRLGVRGRSSMSKAELAEAIQKANDRQTARAREPSDSLLRYRRLMAEHDALPPPGGDPVQAAPGHPVQAAPGPARRPVPPGPRCEQARRSVAGRECPGQPDRRRRLARGPLPHHDRGWPGRVPAAGFRPAAARADVRHRRCILGRGPGAHLDPRVLPPGPSARPADARDRRILRPGPGAGRNPRILTPTARTAGLPLPRRLSAARQVTTPGTHPGPARPAARPWPPGGLLPGAAGHGGARGRAICAG